MMMGLPRSGKSTFAKILSPITNSPIVEPDAVRLALYGVPFIGSREPEVWEHVRLMVRSLFIAGHDSVILDATNLNRTKYSRGAWSSPDWKRHIIYIPTPANVCKERAIAGNKHYLVEVIDRMEMKYDPVVDEELLEGEVYECYRKFGEQVV